MTTNEKVQAIRKRVKKPRKLTSVTMCKLLGISNKTYYRRLNLDNWTIAERALVDALYENTPTPPRLDGCKSEPSTEL